MRDSTRLCILRCGDARCWRRVCSRWEVMWITAFRRKLSVNSANSREAAVKRNGFLALISILPLFLLNSPSAAQQIHSYNSAWKRANGFAKYVEVPGASGVGSDPCTVCHAETSKNFQHAFHKQQGVECEDCHGNGSLHVEGGGDVAKIVSFSKRPAQAANGVCLGCHARDEKVRHWSGGSHSANHLRCVDCHQIHDRALRATNESRISFDTATRGAFTAGSVSPETNVILRPRSATNDACLKCHQTEGAQLSMPYHHPLREGKMSCVDCHDPHGGPAGNNLRTANVNQLCLGCHAQYRGPFAYQHPPVTENCMICHTVHGSPNTNLLQISEPALCLQCHAGHHNGASLPLADRCTNCHGSIHGTDTPTPSGGSRFMDKGPSEVDLLRSAGRGGGTYAFSFGHVRLDAASGSLARADLWGGRSHRSAGDAVFRISGPARGWEHVEWQQRSGRPWKPLRAIRLLPHSRLLPLCRRFRFLGPSRRV